MGRALSWLAKTVGWLVLAAFLGFCGVASLGNAPYKRERDRARRAAASELLVALEAYHSEVGRYPENLEELVPSFISGMPGGADGHEIGYSPRSGLTAYHLEYEEAPWGTLPTDGYHTYDSVSEEWTFEVR